MKTYLQSAVFFLLIMMMQKSSAQITGDTNVCAGNFYTYNANITGAVTYQWTVPSGWYNLQGQGTSQITVNCNVSIGNVCVEGFDGGGTSLGMQCVNTAWGGGGSGLDVQPSAVTYCETPPGYPPYTMPIWLVPNGNSGGSCNPCGGQSNPNIIMGIYDATGVFLGYPDSSYVAVPNVSGTLYVLTVDTSAGINFPQAVSLLGGCGGSGSNTINCTVIAPSPQIQLYPPDACIGSSVQIYDASGMGWLGWLNSYPISGCAQLPGLNIYQILSSPYEVYLSGWDGNGCAYDLGVVTFYANSCTDSVSGDNVVCAGNTYTYNAYLPAGHQCSWIFPPGWYDITGQNTAVCTATCNSIAGNVCAVLTDDNFFTFDTLCINTNFGDGASAGWNAQPSQINLCAGNTSPFTAYITNNGTGGGGSCAAGCGNGVQHPNIVYGLFDNVWPNGTFLGVADSSGSINLPFLPTQYYVYQVDTTPGVNPPQAIKIIGGCNKGVINNIIAFDSVSAPVVVNLATSSACIGDTLILLASDSSQNAIWYNPVNLLLLDSVSNPLYAIVTGLNPSVDLTATDSVSGCGANGNYSINNEACFYPVASFSSNKTAFCLKQYVDFYDMTSNNPTSWQWNFTGGSPSASVLQNPDSIYYAVNGSYDVQLIACNSFSCDTILLPNYIVEYAAPPTPVITGNNGVLYCTPAATYAWYSASNPTVVLSTDSFYIPGQPGDFFVIITDSSGCIAISLVISTTGINQFYDESEFTLNEISPNIFEVILKNNYSNAEIFITDMYGRIVVNRKASNHNRFDLTQYSKGIYLLTVKKGNSLFTRKLQVQ
ncbi:MAG: T9SS type A sorting domain-containing protein [Bacteroidia bacterium]